MFIIIIHIYCNVNFIWSLDAPITLPTITQTPNEPINEGNNVTLTCVIQGGNPLAAITWACDGATQITPTGSPSLSEATSSVELVTSKDNNGQICTCTGKHILWTKDKAKQHTLSVYCKYIYMIVLIGNHGCRILMANHFGEDKNVEIQELTDRSNCGKCML